MKRDDPMLWAAAAVGAVGLVLAVVSLTIVLIAAANPPVSQYLNDEQNAAAAANTRRMVVPAVLVLLMGLLFAAQIVVRRPLLTSADRARRWPASTSRIYMISAVTFGVTLLSSRSVFLAFKSIVLAQSPHATDSLSFGGLGLTAAITSGVWLMLASALFHHWWWHADAAEQHGLGSPTLV